ncbi:uncharacterized protein MYCFIDRAFT_180051 [Pseudocercospora fijiensis CIRAD86]|uniref:Uncharacterized protein n=1 Tax=Pseudocercospora fijiensis (strain CIRAD86) TaxID=383855 RepID=M2YH73_PSEFD|nr:uncharacterized protein MYCFIDRAFT_180051 [Pseudocercospora fijiensis CIRAD86]EME77175.1 hypothetical protein MYCFIDRAFT_180051 [Pseudocercospora fijiensis CIRAD86]
MPFFTRLFSFYGNPNPSRHRGRADDAVVGVGAMVDREAGRDEVQAVVRFMQVLDSALNVIARYCEKAGVDESEVARIHVAELRHTHVVGQHLELLRVVGFEVARGLVPGHDAQSITLMITRKASQIAITIPNLVVFIISMQMHHSFVWYINRMKNDELLDTLISHKIEDSSTGVTRVLHLHVTLYGLTFCILTSLHAILHGFVSLHSISWPYMVCVTELLGEDEGEVNIVGTNKDTELMEIVRWVKMVMNSMDKKTNKRVNEARVQRDTFKMAKPDAYRRTTSPVFRSEASVIKDDGMKSFTSVSGTRSEIATPASTRPQTSYMHGFIVVSGSNSRSAIASKGYNSKVELCGIEFASMIYAYVKKYMNFMAEAGHIVNLIEEWSPRLTNANNKNGNRMTYDATKKKNSYIMARDNEWQKLSRRESRVEELCAGRDIFSMNLALCKAISLGSMTVMNLGYRRTEKASQLAAQPERTQLKAALTDGNKRLLAYLREQNSSDCESLWNNSRSTKTKPRNAPKRPRQILNGPVQKTARQPHEVQIRGLRFDMYDSEPGQAVAKHTFPTNPMGSLGLRFDMYCSKPGQAVENQNPPQDRIRKQRELFPPKYIKLPDLAKKCLGLNTLEKHLSTCARRAKQSRNTVLSETLKLAFARSLSVSSRNASSYLILRRKAFGVKHLGGTPFHECKCLVGTHVADDGLEQFPPKHIKLLDLGIDGFGDGGTPFYECKCIVSTDVAEGILKPFPPKYIRVPDLVNKRFQVKHPRGTPFQECKCIVGTHVAEGSLKLRVKVLAPDEDPTHVESSRDVVYHSYRLAFLSRRCPTAKLLLISNFNVNQNLRGLIGVWHQLLHYPSGLCELYTRVRVLLDGRGRGDVHEDDLLCEQALLCVIVHLCIDHQGDGRILVHLLRHVYHRVLGRLDSLWDRCVYMITLLYVVVFTNKIRKGTITRHECLIDTIMRAEAQHQECRAQVEIVERRIYRACRAEVKIAQHQVSRLSTRYRAQVEGLSTRCVERAELVPVWRAFDTRIMGGWDSVVLDSLESFATEDDRIQIQCQVKKNVGNNADNTGAEDDLFDNVLTSHVLRPCGTDMGFLSFVTRLERHIFILADGEAVCLAYLWMFDPFYWVKTDLILHYTQAAWEILVSSPNFHSDAEICSTPGASLDGEMEAISQIPTIDHAGDGGARYLASSVTWFQRRADHGRGESSRHRLPLWEFHERCVGSAAASHEVLSTDLTIKMPMARLLRSVVLLRYDGWVQKQLPHTGFDVKPSLNRLHPTSPSRRLAQPLIACMHERDSIVTVVDSTDGIELIDLVACSWAVEWCKLENGHAWGMSSILECIREHRDAHHSASCRLGTTNFVSKLVSDISNVPSLNIKLWRLAFCSLVGQWLVLWIILNREIVGAGGLSFLLTCPDELKQSRSRSCLAVVDPDCEADSSSGDNDGEQEGEEDEHDSNVSVLEEDLANGDAAMSSSLRPENAISGKDGISVGYVLEMLLPNKRSEQAGRRHISRTIQEATVVSKLGPILAAFGMFDVLRIMLRQTQNRVPALASFLEDRGCVPRRYVFLDGLANSESEHFDINRFVEMEFQRGSTVTTPLAAVGLRRANSEAEDFDIDFLEGMIDVVDGKGCQKGSRITILLAAVRLRLLTIACTDKRQTAIFAIGVISSTSIRRKAVTADEQLELHNLGCLERHAYFANSAHNLMASFKKSRFIARPRSSAFHRNKDDRDRIFGMADKLPVAGYPPRGKSEYYPQLTAELNSADAAQRAASSGDGGALDDIYISGDGDAWAHLGQGQIRAAWEEAGIGDDSGIGKGVESSNPCARMNEPRCHWTSDATSIYFITPSPTLATSLSVMPVGHREISLLLFPVSSLAMNPTSFSGTIWKMGFLSDMACELTWPLRSCRGARSGIVGKRKLPDFRANGLASSFLHASANLNNSGYHTMHHLSTKWSVLEAPPQYRKGHIMASASAGATQPSMLDAPRSPPSDRAPFTTEHATFTTQDAPTRRNKIQRVMVKKEDDGTAKGETVNGRHSESLWRARYGHRAFSRHVTIRLSEHAHQTLTSHALHGMAARENQTSPVLEIINGCRVETICCRFHRLYGTRAEAQVIGCSGALLRF